MVAPPSARVVEFPPTTNNLLYYTMNNYIKVEVKTDGELYLFSIQRESDGELTITSQKNLPEKIQNLLDDLWTGHAPSSI